jgi:hypothetical protein
MKTKFHKLDLKDFKISNPKKVEKAISHINEKGNLIKDRDYHIKPDGYETMETYIEQMTKSEDRKRKRSKIKSKRKKKGCGCK